MPLSSINGYELAFPRTLQSSLEEQICLVATVRLVTPQFLKVNLHLLQLHTHTSIHSSCAQNQYCIQTACIQHYVKGRSLLLCVFRRICVTWRMYVMNSHQDTVWNGNFSSWITGGSNSAMTALCKRVFCCPNSLSYFTQFDWLDFMILSDDVMRLIHSSVADPFTSVSSTSASCGGRNVVISNVRTYFNGISFFLWWPFINSRVEITYSECVSDPMRVT